KAQNSHNDLAVATRVQRARSRTANMGATPMLKAPLKPGLLRPGLLKSGLLRPGLLKPGLHKLAVLGISALTFTLALSAANAQERVRWKMQSAFGSALPHLGPSGVRFSKDIERMSGGKFEVKFFEPGALIPPLECFDAVSKGSIESCWTTPGYHTGKYP